MKIGDNKIGYYIFLAVFLLGICLIGNVLERHQSLPVFLAFFGAFASYVCLAAFHPNNSGLFSVGLVARVLLFFSLPSLSDDLYRFIWDGTLLKNGIHPFAELPGYYLNQEIPGISQALYEKLNSPDYFTIYPPINQLIFWISASLDGPNWLISAGFIRILLLAADIGSFLILKKLLSYYKRPQSLAHWYWLNPLVILEFTGNLHFEGLVIFLVLVGLYAFEKKRIFSSALGFGLAIGTKLLPLIYLPYLFFSGLKRRQWVYSILAGLFGLLSLLPLWNDAFISGMERSLDLYFRSFEFNGSLYFIARWIGIQVYGYNNIALLGPLLSVFSAVSIIALSAVAAIKQKSIPSTLLFVLSIYLLFATTVHPWYMLPLVAFGILAGYWYPIVWTFLIFLTYLGYSKEGFELPMSIVVIEYAIVTVVLFAELRFKK